MPENNELFNKLKVNTDCIISILNANQSKTKSFAEYLGSVLRNGDTVLLFGEIGSGKTLFARKFIQHRLILEKNVVEEVPSPSFTLVQSYQDGSVPIWHVDLYRLCTGTDVLELDFLEKLESGICLIEWPEIMERYFPERYLAIKFQFSEFNGENRDIFLKALGGGWSHVLENYVSSH